MRAWKGELGSSLKGVLPKWHGSFQVRLTPSVIPSEVEESLILTITSSKRCLDCARHDKKPIWLSRVARIGQTAARRACRLWKEDPRTPAVRFKKVRDVYSVRIGNSGYRAVAVD